MLDATPLPDTTVPAWQRSLQRGDIVSFVFPSTEDDPTEPPKARPCLILELDERAGGRYVELAYGTTSMSSANRGYEVRVMQREDHLLSGLHEPTRFVCARTVSVSLDHPAFRRAPDRGTPLIGRPTEPLIDRMNAVRGRLHAEADIAAERSARRHGTRRIRVSGGREVVVEHRGARKGAVA